MSPTLPIGSLVNVAALAHSGVGKLHEYDELGRAVVHFHGEGTRILAPTTPITRAQLSHSTPVRFKASDGTVGNGTIVEFLTKRTDGGFVYRIESAHGIHDVWEGHIMPTVDTGDPMQLFKSYRWDSPGSFIARWAMTEKYADWFAASGGFPAMLGARIMPLGHQIYAARRVLFDRTPRFILADEVGLGKTIEAGMIIQALGAERPTFSVLVIAPGSMSRQWLTETYLRFGARAYHHLDCTRMAEETNSSLQLLVESQHLIVATTALEQYPKLGTMLAARKWDMVVVDEAHQIPPDNNLYPLLERLARQSHGLLLLSATPSKRDITGLAGMLSLVAPEAFSGRPVDSLQRKYDRQRAVWDRLNFTRKFVEAVASEGRELEFEEVAFAAEEWAGLIEGDAFFNELLRRMRAGDAEAVADLVGYVQEFHRLDHRIIRTRRATLDDAATWWPVRELIELDWSPSQAEAIFLNHLADLPPATNQSGAGLRALYQRFCSTSAASTLRFLQQRQTALDHAPAVAIGDPVTRISADAGPNDEPILLTELVSNLPPLLNEKFWLSTAIALASAWSEEERFSRAERLALWLSKHLADPNNQVLVFVQDSEAVDDLATWLEGELGSDAIARFHCGIAEKELAETAFRFQHEKQCRVLVSDELGGEGRNFQNASAVVHFGLPTSCARLEQRIGRLDRVGRGADRPVVSVVMTPATPSDEDLLAVHRDVFRVFTRTIGGLEFVLPKLQRQVVEAYGLGGSALRDIRRDLQSKVNAALQATDEAFDLSLDATKRELKHSNDLAAQIEESGTSKTESTLRFWASRLGIDAKKRDDGTTEFRWTNGSLKVSGERLKVGLGTDHESRFICGTFQRDVALTHENLQYFAPGHDLVDAMIFEAEHGLHSRATAYVLEGFPNLSGTMLLQVLGRSVLDERLWTAHTISPGLAARARSLLWPEVICEVMLLWDSRGPHHDIVRHVGLRSYLDSPHSRLKMKALDPTIINSLPNLPQLWTEIDEAVPIAISSIANRRQAYAEERAKTLEATLRAEFGFLRWRAETAETPELAELARTEIATRETLIASLRRPRVDLLGLALVVLT